MSTVSFRPSLASVQAQFEASFLPRIRAHAYRRFFPGRPDREDMIAEAIGHGWAMVYRAWQRGRDLTSCPGIVARRAVLRAAAGERLAGNGYTRCRTEDVYARRQRVPSDAGELFLQEVVAPGVDADTARDVTAFLAGLDAQTRRVLEGAQQGKTFRQIGAEEGIAHCMA
jgi:hypothetical protein